jgi:DnaJ-class molecular chaperone
MAGEDDSGDRTEGSHGPQECMPCRGTGKVISNLGGKASTVVCPWCEGEGTRTPEIEAPARGAGESGAGDVGASAQV